jgi:hypothetical protein
VGKSFADSTSPPFSLPSASGCGVDSADFSVGGGENILSAGLAGGAPKLKPVDGAEDPEADVLSPALVEGPPNPKPTGLPILPPGFPKPNALGLGGEALPKATGLSDDPKMLPDGVDDVVVVLPKTLVEDLEVSLSSGVDMKNGEGLLDSPTLLLPKTDVPNTDVGLYVESDVPNALVVFELAKKFGTPLEPKTEVVDAGCDEGAGVVADELSVSRLVEPNIDLVVVAGEVANEKPEVVFGTLESSGCEIPMAKVDFGGSGVDADKEATDGSLDLGAKPKESGVGTELEGGVNAGNEKPPVFVPLSPADRVCEEPSPDPVNPAKGAEGGFGMENCGAAGFSEARGFSPKGDEELDGGGLGLWEGCEEQSNSD